MSLWSGMLVFGLLAVAWSVGWVTPLVYLVLLWFLHRVESPVHDSAGYVRPARFGPQLQGIRYLVAELPGTGADTARVALEFHGWRHGFNWLVALALAERDSVELLSGVAYDQVAFEIPYKYERRMTIEEGDGEGEVEGEGEGTGIDGLLGRMERVGAQYLITYTPELSAALSEAGFKELCAVELSGFDAHGFFQQGKTFKLQLFEATDEIHRIAPAVAIERKPNHLSFPAKEGQRYLLKYAHYQAWQVTDADGKKLLVDDARPGMWITVPRDTTVHLRYRWLSYLTG